MLQFVMPCESQRLIIGLHLLVIIVPSYMYCIYTIEYDSIPCFGGLTWKELVKLHAIG